MTECILLSKFHNESALTALLESSYSKLSAIKTELTLALDSDASMIQKFFLLPLIILGFSFHASASRELKFKLQGQTNQLAPDVGNKKGNRFWGQFDSEYRNYAKDYNSTGIVSGRYTDAGEFMFSVPQAHVDRSWTYFDIHAGRFPLTWAPLDRAWSLGYVNNRQNFNFYKPGEEGLIGVQGSVDFDFGLKFQTFASFMYIPELNPSTQVKDGQVTSKNIWATPTPKYAEINGVLTPIRYSLNKPDMMDIIFRPSYGQLIGYNYKALTWDAYYLLKPENSIRPAGEAKATLNQEIIATINAKLYYEEVYGTNLTAKYNDYKAYVAWMRVDPKNSPANDPNFVQYIKIETQLEARNYAGFGASKKSDRYEVGINWIALLTTPKGAQDILGNKSRFREALDLFINFKITEKLSNHFDIKIDVMKNDKIIMEEIAYEIGRGFVGSLGVNLIDSPQDSSYWAKFRDNDAVYANMAYNF